MMVVKRIKALFVDEIEWLSEDNRLKLLRQQLGAFSSNDQDINDMIGWCNKNCNDIFLYRKNTFYFLDEADLTAFQSKWS